MTATFLLNPTIGAAVTVALTVTGQQLASAFIDQHGLFRMPRRPLTPHRIGGLALLIAGPVLAQLGHVAPQLASRSHRAAKLPCPLLAAGLALLGFGALTATVSVIVTGIGLATLALGVAFTATICRRPSSAPSTLGGATDGVGMADPVRIDLACSLDGVAAQVPRILGWDPSGRCRNLLAWTREPECACAAGYVRIAPDLGESCSAISARRTARTTS